MNKLLLVFICLACLDVHAQTDSAVAILNKVNVYKDPRLDILGKKQADVNAAIVRINARTAQGYRLQVLSTNDREYAMKTRTQLLQTFPEQKAYMFYQAPFVKLRFGNFRTREDAEFYRKQVSRMLNGASVYIIPEKIEVKPEPTEDNQ